MLSLSPSDLAMEYKKAVDFRRKHTDRQKEIIKRLVGNWFRSDFENKTTPENLLFAYMGFMLPELAYSAPSARVTAKRPSLYEDVADGIESALRHWMKENDFGSEQQQVVRDCIIAYGVMKVGLEPVGQAYGDYLRPFACRIPPDQFGMDPRCEHPGDARYMFHEYYRDHDSLRDDPRFDADAVERLPEQDSEKLGERSLKPGEIPIRGLVRLVDFWIPEHGITCTLGVSGQEAQSVFIRPPEKYWGPASGPYEVYGLYRVPGDPYPMSALQSCMEQFEELQLHLKAQADEAATAKSFWLVDSSAKDVLQAMTNARTGDVLPVKDLRNNYVKVETGTLSNQRLEYSADTRDRFDRTLGMSDAQRGITSNATATESQIVKSTTDLRTEWMRSMVDHAGERVLRKVAWYFFNDPNIVMPVSSTDPATGRVSEGIYLGGPQPGQENLSWTDFNLNIEPQSSQYSDNSVTQQRWLQLISLVPQLYQMMQMPGVNVRWLVDQFGSTINWPNLSEVLFQGMNLNAPIVQSGLMPPALNQFMAQPQSQPGMTPAMQPPAQAGMMPPSVPPLNANLSPTPGGPALQRRLAQ